MADFDPTMKKKKKKKVVVDADDAALSTDAPAATADTAAELDKAFDTKKKSKKKAATVAVEETPTAADAAADSRPVAGADLIDYPDWPDWTYEELLTRVYSIMYERNPTLANGEKVKLVLRPPQCMRVGTKKTSFSNFAEICRLLNRNSNHVQAFLLAELGTSGSVDSNSQLILKGRFKPQQFESVIRKYVKEYVTCHTCRSPDTKMHKEDRLFFLQCETCGSRCSVQAIKSGFSAVTVKRARTRAAAGQ